ncbi:TetR/AcrR family transcriptional regulator [Brevibacillus sp. B_LB10_24]|uniref:TetR/AcrR family transcriptional regulator n=1 Tax=Brevibacillus sp. B_LB10_24 TaxID=3380645 RepID=UPI0038BB3B57
MQEEKTKEKIVSFAAKQFLTIGFSKVSTDQIAYELGMSKSTLYKYFPKKEALLHEVVSNFYREQLDDIERIINNTELDFLQKVNQFIFVVGKRLGTVKKSAVLDMKRTAPEAYELLMDFRKNLILRKLSELFQQGVQDHVFRKDMDQTFVVNVILAAIESLTDPDYLLTSGNTYESVFQNVLTLVLEGNLIRERDDDE